MAGALVAAALACRGQRATPTPLELVVSRPGIDTLHFRLPLAARRCSGTADLVLEGDDGASGILVFLRPGTGADTGVYEIHAPAESLAARHARVAARYSAEGVARDVTMDRGTLRVDATPGGWAGSLEGGGVELAGASRPDLRGAFRDVSPPADSTPCSTVPPTPTPL